MLGLAAALVLGFGLGCLAAGAVTGGLDGARSRAHYGRGYHHGWSDGKNRGVGACVDVPASHPYHALTRVAARSGAAGAAAGDAISVASSYQPSGQYQAGAYDCNDMAAQLWSACRQAGVSAFLVVGNTAVDNEGFAACDHCWVVVFCTDEATGREVTLAVDPQARLLGIVGDAVSTQYVEGFFYKDPSGLREDLGTRW